jgi:hypothetical protein
VGIELVPFDRLTIARVLPALLVRDPAQAPNWKPGASSAGAARRDRALDYGIELVAYPRPALLAGLFAGAAGGAQERGKLVEPGAARGPELLGASSPGQLARRILDRRILDRRILDRRCSWAVRSAGSDHWLASTGILDLRVIEVFDRARAACILAVWPCLNG